MAKGLKTAKDLAALLRARNHFVWVTTKEETRVERYLVEAAADAGYIPQTWDCASGCCDMGGKPIADDGTQDINTALRFIGELAKDAPAEQPDAVAPGRRVLWIMRDLPQWLQDPVTVRLVRNLSNTLPRASAQRRQAIVVLSPRSDIPAELSDRCVMVDFPLPDREEIAEIIDSQVRRIPETDRDGNPLRAPIEAAYTNGAREAAIDAAVGLSAVSADSCCAKSLVEAKRIDPIVIGAEKRREIAKSGTLRWVDPLPGGLSNVGGLEGVKSWLATRGTAYTKAAREYGIPAPRGILVVGVSGCGKTLLGKSLASHWGVPFIQGDMGALKGSLLGQSETNMRNMIKTLDAVGRCVLLLDEFEKQIGGATDGAIDGGVSKDQLGQLLSWMQDRTSEAFVVATANDVTRLPPEMLRKGRWDELFWVDVPHAVERAEIIAAALRAHKRAPLADASEVVKATEGFTGAEIAALVPDAMFTAFSDGAREITAADLIAAAQNVVPLTKTAEGKIKAMREWAKGKARPASVAAPAPSAPLVSAIGGESHATLDL